MAQGERCTGNDSICWLALLFWSICCAAFVVFLFVTSSLHLTNFNATDPASFHKVKSGILVVYPENHIVINMSDAKNTTKSYIKTLDNLMKGYECIDGLDNTCDDIRSSNTTTTWSSNHQRQCLFNVSSLGHDCSSENHFGYLQSKPCILLRIEKADYFVPKSFSSLPPQISSTMMKPEDEKKFSLNHLFVTCHGVKKTDHNRMRQYQVFPQQGLPMSFYPIPSGEYASADSFPCESHSPLVAVQFPDLTTGTNITITCRVWSANVDELKRYYTTFSISII